MYDEVDTLAVSKQVIQFSQDNNLHQSCGWTNCREDSILYLVCLQMSPLFCNIVVAFSISENKTATQKSIFV